MEDHPTIDACMGAEQHSYQAAAEQEEPAQDRLQQALSQPVPLLAGARDLHVGSFCGWVFEEASVLFPTGRQNNSAAVAG
jgi:hypothetical protein